MIHSGNLQTPPFQWENHFFSQHRTTVKTSHKNRFAADEGSWVSSGLYMAVASETFWFEPEPFSENEKDHSYRNHLDIVQQP